MRKALGCLAALLVASGAAGATQDWDATLKAEFGPELAAQKISTVPVAPDRRLTPLLVLARQHWEELSPQTQALMRPWMQRPTNAANLPDPAIAYANPEATPVDSTHFRIHYINRAAFPSDPNAATTEWATQVALIMEEVWTAEHTTLGYAGVPPDTSVPPGVDNGGDNRFDVYLAELGRFNLYGYVTSEAVGTADTTRPHGTHSYMVIENDFAGFPYDDPVLPLKVTAAHEYFHAIQLGYDYREDAAFMEQSSTWMEDMVYTEINDNYQYIGEPYTDLNGNGQYDVGEGFTDRNGNGQRDSGSTDFPEVPLDGFDVVPNIQYGRFLWPRYLSERHGAIVMTRAWENCGTLPEDNAFDAVANALASTTGVSLRNAYQEYAVWGYDTARFSEGTNYPLVWVDGSTTTTANFSSASTPSLAQLAAAGLPVQMHLSTVYEQIVSPSGNYTFTSTGGDPALTMVVRGAEGTLTYQEVAINGGTGTWTAPPGTLRAVAVISNASAIADGMTWTLCSGTCGSSVGSPSEARSSDGGGGAGGLAVLAIGFGALARRRWMSL